MSSGQTTEWNERPLGPARLGLALLRVLGAVACLCLGALLSLIEPLVRLILGVLAVLALLLSGFYAFAVPFKAFPVFGLLGAALTLSLAIGVLSALRSALSRL